MLSSPLHPPKHYCNCQLDKIYGSKFIFPNLKRRYWRIENSFLKLILFSIMFQHYNTEKFSFINLGLWEMLPNLLVPGSACFRTVSCTEQRACIWQKYTRAGILLFFFSKIISQLMLVPHMLLDCELWQGFSSASGICQGKGASSTQCQYLWCFTRSLGCQDGGGACAKILPLKRG